MRVLQTKCFRQFAALPNTVAAHCVLFLDEKRVYRGMNYNIMRLMFLLDPQSWYYEITGFEEEVISSDVVLRAVLAPFVHMLEKGIEYTLLDGVKYTAYGTMVAVCADMETQQNLL